MNLPHAAGACRTAVVQRAFRNLFLASVLAMQGAAFPAAAGEEPLSNLAVMQELARGIGMELAARIPGADTVAVATAFAPEALAWVVQGPIRQALAARPARLVSRRAGGGPRGKHRAGRHAHRPALGDRAGHPLLYADEP